MLGHLASVKKLLTLKARLHIFDNEGRIALHSAVTSTAPASVKVVELIQEAILASSNRLGQWQKSRAPFDLAYNEPVIHLSIQYHISK